MDPVHDRKSWNWRDPISAFKRADPKFNNRITAGFLLPALEFNQPAKIRHRVSATSRHDRKDDRFTCVRVCHVQRDLLVPRIFGLPSERRPKLRITIWQIFTPD